MSARIATAVLGALLLAAIFGRIEVTAQSQPVVPSTELVRRAKSRVEPSYPELARKMSITGVVKVEVVVSPNGSVKDARVVGGHPVLATAALDAARRWRFEPAPAESTGVIEFKFAPR